ncbi:MAG: hypothetical protein AB7O50_01130 [Pseudolabrys sp.]
MRIPLVGLVFLMFAGAGSALAQSQQPAAPAPVKPYQPVMLSLPEPFKDPAFEAFRGRLADAARKKDRAALAKLTVARGFFWERENGDGADKKKSGIDNLVGALGLKTREAAGWDMIAAFADDPTVSSAPNHKSAVCAPGDPTFDHKAFGAMLDATQTDIFEWAFPIENGIQVRAAGASSSPVVEKLGLHFVRVLADDTPAAAVAAAVKIATPSGKTGYVQADTLAPLGNDQICYVKDGSDWKVVGYIGAGDEQ